MSAVAMAYGPRTMARNGGARSHLPTVGAREGAEVQNLDVCAVTRHAVALLRATGVMEATEVRLELPDEPVFARVSARRLEQVLFHLVAHALDSRGIRLSVEPQDDFGDYGPTFRVRYPGQRPPAEEPSGRGLSVVRELVEDMGGLLTVKDRGLTGTTVTVELPDQGTASW